MKYTVMPTLFDSSSSQIYSALIPIFLVLICINYLYSIQRVSFQSSNEIVSSLIIAMQFQPTSMHY